MCISPKIVLSEPRKQQINSTNQQPSDLDSVGGWLFGEVYPT